MSDQPNPTPDQTGTPPSQAQNSDTNAGPMIPKARFDEVNEQLKELRTWKEKQEAHARKQQEDAAKQRGEWEQLANERGQRVTELETTAQTAQERAERYQQVLEAQVKERIKALPEASRKLVPDGDPLDQLTWLNALDAAIAAQQPAPLRSTNGGGARVNGGSGSNTDLIAEHRARMGGL